MLLLLCVRLTNPATFEAVAVAEHEGLVIEVPVVVHEIAFACACVCVCVCVCVYYIYLHM
jgi:hypothetical protein